MRHTFLPQSDQKSLKREYRVHVIVVAVFLSAVVALVGVISLFPAYVHTIVEEKAQSVAQELTKKNTKSDEIANLEKELVADAAQLKQISGFQEQARPSALIRNIVEARGSIRIVSISILDISSSTASMNVQGNAPTRDSLISFKTRLESISIGTKVELPLSGLAKNKDINFSLKVTQILK